MRYLWCTALLVLLGLTGCGGASQAQQPTNTPVPAPTQQVATASTKAPIATTAPIAAKPAIAPTEAPVAPKTDVQACIADADRLKLVLNQVPQCRAEPIPAESTSAPIGTTSTYTIPVRITVTRGTELLLDQPIVPGDLIAVQLPGKKDLAYTVETDRLKVSWFKWFCGVGPGQNCRISLSGHRWSWTKEKNTPAFGRLCEVEIGDIATLYTADGTAYRFRINYSKELDADSAELQAHTNANVDEDDQGKGSILTMITCSGTTQQMVDQTVASHRCIAEGVPID